MSFLTARNVLFLVLVTQLEVEAFNVLLNKAVTLSSNYDPDRRPPSLATDGYIPRDDYLLCINTGDGPGWLRIDIGTPTPIHWIRLFANNLNLLRIENVDIRVGNDTSADANLLCANTGTNIATMAIDFECLEIITGSYVTLQRSNTLQCCEVEAFSFPKGTNYALNKPVTMSTNNYSPGQRDPELLTDGSYSSADASTCIHTQHGEVNPWAKVDLGKQYVVYFFKLAVYREQKIRGSNVEVRIGNVDGLSSQNPYCATTQQDVLKSTYNGRFDCETVLTGRYVTLQQMAADEVLQVCELEVYSPYDGVNMCLSNPCSHGTCNVEFESYNCSCNNGYTGVHCETELNECIVEPCQNGGTCSDGVNSYVCTCTAGYTGSDCETDIDECVSNPCQNGGTCKDLVDGYNCTCVTGYVGISCETDFDDCLSNPCQNGGTCTDLVDGHNCTCSPGIFGASCETDLDECGSDPCQNGGTCIDYPNSFSCTCTPGITGIYCQTDVDECSSNPCINNGTCVDDVNGYTCECSFGFPGYHCETEIDECYSNPCKNGASCLDGIDSYNCTCASGFDGVQCEIDINECESDPCQNGGTCKDLADGYNCTCVPGYVGILCETDFDECRSGPCQNGGSCTDHVNGFSCACVSYYSGIVCETDIDECVSNPCQNGGTCKDLVDGYNCTCVTGYVGISCETDFDDCVSNPCQNGGTCKDLVGGYNCTCVTGYVGISCETDFDDCVSNPCQNGGTCKDLVDGYNCTCVSGYVGISCETDLDECVSNPCQNGGTCLLVAVNAYICECEPEYSGEHCQTAIDRCSSLPCLSGATCTTIPGGYNCTCSPGYIGPQCETDVDECASDPCMNYATCNDFPNYYNCTCYDGFRGYNCEEDYRCVGWSAKFYLNDGKFESFLKRIRDLSYGLSINITNNRSIKCLFDLEATSTDIVNSTYLLSLMGVFIGLPEVKENIEPLMLNFGNAMANLSPIVNKDVKEEMDILVKIIHFLTIGGESSIEAFASAPEAGIELVTYTVETLGPVVDQVANITKPKQVTDASTISASKPELNFTCPQPEKGSENQTEGLVSDVGNLVLGVLKKMVGPLQSLINRAIIVDSPPIYILSTKCSLENITNITFSSPYGSLVVHDIQTTRDANISMSTTIMCQFTAIGQNVFGGNSTSEGMDNSVIKLELSDVNGLSIHDHIITSIETTIVTKESLVKQKTLCLEETIDCPELTDNAIEATKTIKSTFYLPERDSTFRIITKGSGFYKLWMKGNTEPDSTSYDVSLVNNKDGPAIITTTWTITLEQKTNKLIILIYDFGEVSISEIHVLLTQEEVVNRNRSKTFSHCEAIEVSGSTINMAILSKDGQYTHPKNTRTSSKHLSRVKRSIDPEYQLVQVYPESDDEKTVFKSNFLGTITADLFYPPNTINFKTVFKDFRSKIADNWAVLGLMCGSIVLYLIIIIILHRLDRRERKQWQFKPLLDNAEWHTHLYKVSVATGKKTKGDMSSVKLMMRITGSTGFSGPRILETEYDDKFKPGIVSNFYMTMIGSLGCVQGIELWLEQTQQYEEVLLHVLNVSVNDLQKGDRYLFVVNSVLRVQTNSKANCVLVAIENSMTNFLSLFSNHTKQGIFNYHLWLSSLRRPTYNDFNRVQRFTCCISLLFLSMVANCMWYNTDTKAPPVGLRLGPIYLTWSALYSGTLTILMVVPVHMGLSVVFRNIRSQKGDFYSLEHLYPSANITEKRTKKIPRWCIVPAWIVLVLTILGSSFFCFLYSMEWGAEVSREWLSSLILGTLEDILLLQALIVVVIAFSFAILMKLPSDPTDSDGWTRPVWRKCENPETERSMKKLDKKMYWTIRNVSLSLLYLVMISYIASASMDPNTYNQNKAVLDLLVPGPGKPISGVTGRLDEFYDWMIKMVIPFSSTTGPYKDRGNYRPTEFFKMGPARIVQVRHPKDNCQYAAELAPLTHDCVGYNRDEDRESYGISWNYTSVSSNISLGEHFRFRSSSNLNNVQSFGVFSYYSGGGYAADMSDDPLESIKLLNALRNSDWLTTRTKAVVLQMTLYNANTNLFTQVKIWWEKTPFGKAYMTPAVESFRLYTFVGLAGGFTLAVQAIWVLLLIYFLINEILAVKKIGRKYFDSIFNIGYWIHLMLAVTSIGLFIGRIPYIIRAVEQVHNSKDTFVSFDLLAFWDAVFVSILSLVLFFAFLDLLKFFRFIQNLAVLLATIKRGSKQLLSFGKIIVSIIFVFSGVLFCIIGDSIAGFKSITTSFATLLSSVLGKFSKDVSVVTESFLGGILFITFSILVAFIMMDLFVSVLNDTQTTVQQNINLAPYDADLMNHMKMRCKELLTSLFGKNNEQTEENDERCIEEEKSVFARLEKLEASLDSTMDNWYRYMIAATYLTIPGNCKSFLAMQNNLKSLEI